MRPFLFAAAAFVAVPALAQDAGQTARIIDEGMNHSQVMTTAQHLSDVIGPRLTNSPQMRVAEGWTLAKFTEWGLKNARKEGFDFGRGWSIDGSSVRMTTPRVIQLTAIPIAWTPPTNGTLTAPIVVAPMEKKRDFAQYRGKLTGKIVLVSQPGNARDLTNPRFKRYTGDDLSKLDQFDQPKNDPAADAKELRENLFEVERDAFLKAEGAVGYATISYRDGKLVHGEGYMFETGKSPSMPGVQIAAEDYRRLARLAKIGPAPALEIVSQVKYDDSDQQGYNILADIPGADAKAGYVMAGAHLDSWVAGDGATDNGAGSAMIMEAARILSAMGVRPKRTIRFALWSGEEQGLFGSIAYVEKHLATRGSPNDPNTTGLSRYFTWDKRWPITPQPGYRDLAAYFNIDNGSGKLRGIYAENNPAAANIFQEWMAPFRSMGMTQVATARTGGTDHVFMQSIGAPGFQFIQDPLDYDSVTHHSSADTYDHLRAEDMRQGATILAAFLLNAANAEKALPRPPLPTKPAVTDPFAYPESDD
ncbi:M20/M25/M40 family metallo-hydrolase [Sphingomonas sp. SUN019]|uniref:M20/M25/M40 family metallo-hydrolase n=1 Tax=Sphingomonas sp. SUN019 TaxID=2937788 RepID=UPI002164C3A0|nr:M20/M25/M40 family metallo-hydrolase [Sphingomonas sp. SUN019]UVO49594.1 M20/M25/M40 family metallo-hydrolase [Sphingomonas sp. SUN019]